MLLRGMAFAGALLLSAPAWALSMTFNIEDLVTDTDTSATYAGTGFTGVYENEYNRLFGIENDGGFFSRTIIQVDISSLAGSTITSATLSFVLLDGDDGTKPARINSFDADGVIEFFNSTPASLGEVTFNSVKPGTNNVDVTSLVSDRVGNQWLGLFVEGDNAPVDYQWTYTSADDGRTRDSALVRLTVEYENGEDVPAPATLTLLGAGLLGFGVWRRRRA